MNDIRQSIEYANFLKKNGWIVLKIDESKNSLAFVWKTTCNTFNLLQLHRNSEIEDFEVINKIIKKYKIAYVRIEANINEDNKIIQNKLLENNFKISKWIQNPTATQIINLNKPLKIIFKELKSSKRHILRAKRNKLKIENINGKKVKQNKLKIKEILNFFYNHEKEKKLAHYPKTWIHDLIDSFKEKSHFIVAYNNKKEIISAGFFLESNDTMFYIKGSGNKEGYKKDSFYLLMWQAIEIAKKRKLKYFDFEGVYDERHHEYTNSWKGFTQFKKSFGGQERKLLPAYEKIIKKDLNIKDKILKKIFLRKFLPNVYMVYSN